MSQGQLTIGLSKMTNVPVQDEGELVKPFSAAETFEKFASQVKEVEGILLAEGTLNAATIKQQLNWFYGSLGFHEQYFRTTPPAVIAKHILSLHSARVLGENTGKQLDIQLAQERDNEALFVSRSMQGDREHPCKDVEQRIETEYMSEGYAGYDGPARAWRMQCYRSNDGVRSVQSGQHICVYFLQKPEYVNPKADPNETDLNVIASKQYLATATEKSLQQHKEIIEKVVARPGGLGVQLEYRRSASGDCIRLTVAYRRGTTHSFLSSVMSCYHYHKLFATRKYVEQFSNGVVVKIFYLRCIDGDDSKLDTRAATVVNDLSLKYVLPRTAVSEVMSKSLNAQEAAYAYCAWKFAFQFLNRLGDEYEAIAKALAANPASASTLYKIKSRLKENTFTESMVFNALVANPRAIHVLFAEFDALHNPLKNTGYVAPAGGIPMFIKKNVDSLQDQEVFKMFHLFNTHILKTNFFKKDKAAISFRLTPDFLPKAEFPDPLFAMFFLVGAEFRGFHLRFVDIARGGIRMVRSATKTAYLHNANSIFDENYALAYTQHRKNKDIPEGGSKGAILLARTQQKKAKVAFRKYIDALLDLLIPHPDILDKFGKQEILFCGPDEGTAEYMDWACLHAKSRGYSFWKSFTTGKSQSLGGIPHDTYGMTTSSVQTYVRCLLAKVGVDERTITKLQTGGPDGDLGSNCIKQSLDKTIGVVDGSGVLYDPEGINRVELVRLATKRQMIRHFDRSKLSARGFQILVEHRDVRLPDGTVVPNGAQFRNEFHLNPMGSADLLMPCGGRPQSINSANVDRMFDANGKPRFKWIVEGANLFIGQDARLTLEKAGVVLFKDASTNKGGVTSSSQEVMAALALSDEEYEQHMMKKGGVLPEYYQTYVKECQRKIIENAKLEFHALMREKERTGIPSCTLTDQLSMKIVKLQQQIESSKLYEDVQLRDSILKQALPSLLLESIGLPTILKRVPDNYMRAVFGARMASRLVYEQGLSAQMPQTRL